MNCLTERKANKQKNKKEKVREGNRWQIEKPGEQRFTDSSRWRGKGRKGRRRGQEGESFLYVPIFQDPLELRLQPYSS